MKGADTLSQLDAGALFAFVSSNDTAGNPRNLLTLFQSVYYSVSRRGPSPAGRADKRF